jgi:hypothetical protein
VFLVTVSMVSVFLVRAAPVMGLHFPLVNMLLMVGVVMVSDQLSMRVDEIIVMMVDDLGLVMVNQVGVGGVRVLAEEMLVDEGIVHGWDLDVVGHLFRMQVRFRENCSKCFKMNWVILV